MNGLHAVVLAAGAGSRFGGGKLLAPWRGGALLDGALAAALAAPVDRVTVVTGAGSDAVAAAARAFAGRNGAAGRLSVVYAPGHADGMAASLRAGVAAVSEIAQGVLVFLGDMPLIPPEAVEGVAGALLAGAPAAAPAFEGRQGHPVGLSRALFARVAALEGDRGARRILDSLGGALVVVPVADAAILVDVDRPEQLPD